MPKILFSNGGLVWPYSEEELEYSLLLNLVMLIYQGVYKDYKPSLSEVNLKPDNYPEKWDLKIGYAPPRWEFLYDYLKNRHANYLDDAIKYGLVCRSSRLENKYYDRFRDRLIFPIYNDKNFMVGLIGMIAAKNAKPKYLLSKPNKYFTKTDSNKIFNILIDGEN